MTSKLITVDMTEVQARILAALPRTGATEQIVQGVALAASQYWKKLAQERLRSSSRDYVEGIQLSQSGANAEIKLVGRLPNMIEQGMSAFDMRKGLLEGPSAKTGADGKKYNTVPFRHGTPGTTGRNVGRQMPADIHREAKKLTPTISRPGPPVSTRGGHTLVYGERLHPGRPMRETARKILETKEKPHHTASIYMGMIRNAQMTRTGKTQTSGYMTFRRISEKSHPQAWMHPGITAKNLASEVQTYIGAKADAIIKGMLK